MAITSKKIKNSKKQKKVLKSHYQRTMSKFQVPSSNGVGCVDGTDRQTDRQTDTYSHEPNSEESLLYFWLFFMSMFCVNRIGLEVK